MDLYKELKAKFGEKTLKEGVEVCIQKLFSKHISVEEHQALLSAEHPGKLINVYVGVPNRIKKLIELGSIKVSSRKFRCLVFDTHLNQKNLSLFDIWETRDDTFDILLLSRKQLFKRKLKVCLV